MSLTDLRALACPHCGRGHDLLLLLDRATRSWPAEGWIAVQCPQCDVQSHVQIRGEDVAIGSLTASSPRVFRPDHRVAQPGLRTQGAPDGLLVHLLHRRWFVTAR